MLIMLNNFVIKRDNIIKEKTLLKKQLTNINKELIQIEQVINKLCNHNWVTDFIDKPYGEGSVKIVYCDNCYLNKK